MIICVVGTGKIGSAIAESLLQSSYGKKIIATNKPSEIEKIRNLEDLGAKITTDNKKAASQADIVILCVKPNDVKDVIEEIKQEIEGKLVISVVSAVSLNVLKSVAPKARFVRAMTNIAVLIQEAFTAYCTDSNLRLEDEMEAEKIFRTMGKTAKIDEKHMDAITGLSGSGPAYVSIIIEALMYGGLKVGLSKELALLSSVQTVLGTAKLALDKGIDLSKLREMVVTPNGTTIEGIYEIEKRGVRTAIIRAVEAATKKSIKIARKLK